MEEKNEKPVVETTEQKDIPQETGKLKAKKPKNLGKVNEPAVAKVDMAKVEEKQQEATEEVAKVDLSDDKKEEVVEEVKETVEDVKEEETPVIEEIVDEETSEQKEEETVEEVKEQVEEAVQEAQQTGEPLPENIQKVVDFMKETGGSLEDYVSLNKDYSSFDEASLLREYYKQTKPHLSSDEVDFMLEDQFSYDENSDDERDIKRKKLALKEQVANAKSHLDGLKSKYYEEIKAGSKLLPEQQKAIDFFNRYNKEAEQNQKLLDRQQSIFNKKTNEVFNEKFKGFEFNVGEKKYRFNVKNPDEVKQKQSSIDNFVSKFLGKDNTIDNAKDYHKSLFTAMNPDAVARHFYEQGKADAIKDSVAKSKNINMDPRAQHSTNKSEFVDGIKVRHVTGSSASDFKVRIKK
tara:strand:+ start:932 stop:2149 length:1218 start_codon:yes stop_codon:yes gene_type:complete